MGVEGDACDYSLDRVALACMVGLGIAGAAAGPAVGGAGLGVDTTEVIEGAVAEGGGVTCAMGDG